MQGDKPVARISDDQNKRICSGCAELLAIRHYVDDYFGFSRNVGRIVARSDDHLYKRLVRFVGKSTGELRMKR
jgi:hypothetical protein